MHLFGQQLFTQSVEADELPCQQTSINEPFSHQHNFTNQHKVWDHHCTGPDVGKLDNKNEELLILVVRNLLWNIQPEQCLEVLREFSSTSVTWIQSDEDPHCRLQFNFFSKKLKSFCARTETLKAALKQIYIIKNTSRYLTKSASFTSVFYSLRHLVLS